jgi:hypothetical protein
MQRQAQTGLVEELAPLSHTDLNTLRAGLVILQSAFAPDAWPESTSAEHTPSQG